MSDREQTDAPEYAELRTPREPIALPPPAEWSAAAVRLLQGVVYHDDNRDVWEAILSHQSPLIDFFGRLGLLLVVNEADGMAYLRQPDEEDLPPEFDSIPRLFRRSPLGYEATLLCVLLRDELRIFEEEDVQNERCVVSQHDLLKVWEAFFPNQPDAVKLNRSLQSALRKLEDLKFVRQFEAEPPSWEIRRILKARVPLSDLEQLRQTLIEEAQRRGLALTQDDDGVRLHSPDDDTDRHLEIFDNEQEDGEQE